MSNFRHDSYGLQTRLLSPPRPMERIHHHSEVELNYVFRGSVTYLHKWSRRQIRSGQLVLFWGSSPHSLISVAPGTKMAWITIPLSWVLQWKIPTRMRKALLEGQWCFSTGKTGRYPVQEWVHEIKKGASEALLLELQACALRMQPGPSLSPQTKIGPGFGDEKNWKHVECMAQFVAAHFTEDIGIPDISTSVKLHPKYAMTLFRHCCGITLHDYLERHRLTHAQRLLLTTSDKIIEIAYASGYNSLSAFYQQFEKTSGCSPGAFKKNFQSLLSNGNFRFDL